MSGSAKAVARKCFLLMVSFRLLSGGGSAPLTSRSLEKCPFSCHSCVFLKSFKSV